MCFVFLVILKLKTQRCEVISYVETKEMCSNNEVVSKVSRKKQGGAARF